MATSTSIPKKARIDVDHDNSFPIMSYQVRCGAHRTIRAYYPYEFGEKAVKVSASGLITILEPSSHETSDPLHPCQNSW